MVDARSTFAGCNARNSLHSISVCRRMHSKHKLHVGVDGSAPSHTGGQYACSGPCDCVSLAASHADPAAHTGASRPHSSCSESCSADETGTTGTTVAFALFTPRDAVFASKARAKAECMPFSFVWKPLFSGGCLATAYSRPSLGTTHAAAWSATPAGTCRCGCLCFRRRFDMPAGCRVIWPCAAIRLANCTVSAVMTASRLFKFGVVMSCCGPFCRLDAGVPLLFVGNQFMNNTTSNA